MSIQPIITFKAGQCEVDTSSKPYKVTPLATKGYIYLYSEDELIHFCWRPRQAQLDEPELDLMMIPTDGHFVPYDYKTSDQPTSKTNGRIFVLKFSSSSQRHLFWLQSQPQRADDPSSFSTRDQKIGQIVDSLLQGEDVNVRSELEDVQNSRGGDDGDETMEDVEGHGDPSEHHEGSGGGAGTGATGGDVRQEGESSREGGADGGRANAALSTAAPTDAQTAVNNFLASLRGSNNLSQGGEAGEGQTQDPYTTLSDLLTTSTTIPLINNATEAQLDNFLSYLPPTVLLLAQESSAQIDGMVEPTSGTAQAALEALSVSQKRAILKRVLHSPQFSQGLGSLTMALQQGGLPSVAEALKIKVDNKAMYAQGGEAVRQFVEGIKKSVVEEGQ
ncbi:hypothetical protein V493_07246 [Pseudogymnoascus sp. VKM F-4281 (FW-2241)]|nr:hypothetical protein V493_07246 [Pseudogymnoascus sp. VKM F-4281 (FW-2241)]